MGQTGEEWGDRAGRATGKGENMSGVVEDISSDDSDVVIEDIIDDLIGPPSPQAPPAKRRATLERIGPASGDWNERRTVITWLQRKRDRDEEEPGPSLDPTDDTEMAEPRH